MQASSTDVIIDGVTYTLDGRRVTGAQLLALVPAPAPENIWLDVDGAQDRHIAPDQSIPVASGAVFFTDRARTIFIDGVEYHVRSGLVAENDLRQLPAPPIEDDHVLYRDILDDLDVRLAPGELVKLNPGDRFFSKERVTQAIRIVVNLRRHIVEHRRVSYEQVVELAYPNSPAGEGFTYTVTYSRAAGPRAEGTLTPGDVVRVKEGTVFDVRLTDKS